MPDCFFYGKTVKPESLNTNYKSSDLFSG